ncbi:aminotransferase DegT, partial [Streptococcus suis]
MAFDFTQNLTPFENKVWLASPTMHGDELEYMKEAYDTNWMTTAGSNINALEEMIKEYTKSEQVVALS